MKKLNVNRLCVTIIANCFIDADKLMMYNVNTNEIKSYKEIDDKDDIGNWLVSDMDDVIRDCDELEHDGIDIEEA
jgi:hypothetical protein